VCKPEAACTPLLVACVRNEAADGGAEAARVTRRRLAEPLDACVLGGVLTRGECGALRAEAAALGYSFWSPGARTGKTLRTHAHTRSTHARNRNAQALTAAAARTHARALTHARQRRARVPQRRHRGGHLPRRRRRAVAPRSGARPAPNHTHT
jgi:hypothetical protein